MPKSFLDFLQSMTIAMEADDITAQTANEVRSAIGGVPSTQNEEVDRKEVEDLEKVDDIFGTEAPKDDPSGDPEQDKNEGAEDIPSMEEPTEDENPEEGMPEEDPNLSESDSEDDNASNQHSDDLVFTKKNRIRDNLTQLYTIITGNIEIIVNSLTNINDDKTVGVLNIVLNHLRNCKSYIYKTLTQNITELDYDELLQRYITLKRIYDICISMMEKHFNKEK